MNDLWVVLVRNGSDVTAFGPLPAKEAQAFAQFMTQTVDPAEIRKLNSPVAEMLAWHESELARNDCTHGAGCPVHPLASLPHG